MDNFFEFTYKKYTFKLVSVRHDSKNIDVKKLLDESNTKSPMCFLIEADKNLKKDDIRRQKGDFTTKFFINELKKVEKNNVKKCVKGWDIRQEILGNQTYQDQLYHKFFDIPFFALHSFYLLKLEQLFNRRITEKNIEKNIKIFLEFHLNHTIKTKTDAIKYYMGKIANLQNDKNFDKKPLKALYTNKTKEYFDKLRDTFYQAYAMVSDLFFFELFLKTDIKSNYIVIMGEYHFKDTINFYNFMKKDNII